MKVQVLEKADNDMRLLIRGVDVSYLNALRRVALAEVPSMAIDDVVVIESSSVLPDEILAHRLGLIPLTTDLDAYNLPEECACKSEFGCSLCRATLTLEIEATDSMKTVYSGDLIPENPDIKPVSSKIPIVKLAPDQKIKLEAYARLGHGKNHAKWQPVSKCVYKYLPKVQIDEARCNNCRRCARICPEGILVSVKGKIEIRNEIECTLCQDCMDACPTMPTAIKVTRDKDAFIFDIESTGALPTDRIVIEALNIMNKKIDGFLSLLNV